MELTQQEYDKAVLVVCMIVLLFVAVFFIAMAIRYKKDTRITKIENDAIDLKKRQNGIHEKKKPLSTWK